MDDTRKQIIANDRTVSYLLNEKKYTIDFFQREYRWRRKHIEELISDLEAKFFSNYKEYHELPQVKSYSRYYLGPIVLCEKKGQLSIIDGQQRLTSLTLLLMYLNNLQKELLIKKPVTIESLIFSDVYSMKSFNLNIDERERKECMEALYKGNDYQPNGKDETVTNIVDRYHDIQELFPEEVKNDSLPFFMYWLKDNVILVEIITHSDEDAYTIFETMNDRGLNLTSTEMLKGYLLSNLASDEQKHELNDIWKENIRKLHEYGDDKDSEFFKTWLRAKHAVSIRPGKRGAANEDFEKIGTRFHNWVRDKRKSIGLQSPGDFHSFITREFQFFVKVYRMIFSAEETYSEELEHIYYISKRGFTLHYPLLLAPITLDDDDATIKKKLALVSRFVETLIVYRSVNYRTLGYSALRYTIFSLVKELRDNSVEELAALLKEKILAFDEDLSGMKNFGLHQQNKRFVHLLLARITYHIEKQSNLNSRFEDYIRKDIKKPYEIEHLWADNYDMFKDEFDQRDEFDTYRNMIGALVLIPRGFNQSYGDLPYEEKLPHYYGQNLLVRSLNEQCYHRNPGFVQYMNQSGLPLKAYEHFTKNDVIERQTLYQNICEEIYHLDGFDDILRR